MNDPRSMARAFSTSCYICSKLCLMNSDYIDMQIPRPEDETPSRDAWGKVRPRISDRMWVSSCKNCADQMHGKGKTVGEKDSWHQYRRMEEDEENRPGAEEPSQPE